MTLVHIWLDTLPYPSTRATGPNYCQNVCSPYLLPVIQCNISFPCSILKKQQQKNNNLVLIPYMISKQSCF